jgi:hypothetical protein
MDNSNLFIPATPGKPLVLFDLEAGIFELKGPFRGAYMGGGYENTGVILEKFDEFTLTYPNKSLIANFNIVVIGSNYYISLGKMLRKIETHFQNSCHPKVVINWYHDDDEPDTLELGKEFQSILVVPFNFIKEETKT